MRLFYDTYAGSERLTRSFLGLKATHSIPIGAPSKGRISRPGVGHAPSSHRGG
jgi:hypothetical protein